MKINLLTFKIAAGLLLTAAFGVVVVSCGNNDDDPAPASSGPTAPVRVAAISCGGGNGGGGYSIAGDEVTATTVLTGNQETPAVCTSALANGDVLVNTATGAITGKITFETGFTPTAAHIHQGAAGVAGSVIITLTQDTDPKVWNVPASTTLTAAQLTAFTNGELYFNAHTSAHTGGEIRGQIGREVHTAALTGAQDGNSATGTGTGRVVLDPVTKAATGTFTVTGLTGNATAAHIHQAAFNSTGGVIFPMTETSPGSGIFNTAALTLTDPQITALGNGEYYFNVHTVANGSGELRGRIFKQYKFHVHAVFRFVLRAAVRLHAVVEDDAR